MQIHLFEDSLTNGQQVAFGDTPARTIYMTAGEVTVDGTVHACGSGFVASGPLALTAGTGGASLWRWDLSDAPPVTPPQQSAKKLSGQLPDQFAEPGNFLRLDSVAFPPAGFAMLHTHQGPGIRCLRKGTIRIDTDGHSTAYGPGGPWFEIGPVPVFAQGDAALPHPLHPRVRAAGCPARQVLYPLRQRRRPRQNQVPNLPQLW